MKLWIGEDQFFALSYYCSDLDHMKFISFFTFMLSRYVYVSVLLVIHLSLMKLYGSRSSNNEAITFEKNLIRFIYSSNALAKKPKTIYLSS
jgi:hypothetical protein